MQNDCSSRFGNRPAATGTVDWGCQATERRGPRVGEEVLEKEHDGGSPHAWFAVWRFWWTPAADTPPGLDDGQCYTDEVYER